MDKVMIFSKKIIENKLGEFNIAIDCTAGRGNDTLFLSKLFNKVYSFDIQDEAISSTNSLLIENNITNVSLIKDSHANIDKYIIDNIDCAMFNLGYLPKGDKNICTLSNSTKEAINKIMGKLNKYGIISIILYPGCPTGFEESNEIMEYLKDIDQKEFDIIKYDFINQINYPPYAIIIEKR